MTHPVLDAAEALCRVLEQENDALNALDVPRAVGHVDAKRAAIDALVQAQRAGAPTATPAALARAEQLQQLAEQNKCLLERAMAAQTRVMACIARAVPKAAARHGGYGATGAASRAKAIPPVAVSARA